MSSHLLRGLARLRMCLEIIVVRRTAGLRIASVHLLVRRSWLNQWFSSFSDIFLYPLSSVFEWQLTYSLTMIAFLNGL